MSLNKKGRVSKKENILESAKILFSEKGYDATSMDEIALQTGVPKSLIYYHFKNKEELLQAIVDRFFLEYQQLLREGWNKENDSMERYFDFWDTNSAFLRIILVESLKKTNGNISVFNVVKLLLQFESEVSGNKDLIEYDKSHSRWVAEFFTNIVPCLFFVCYADDWCNHFGVDKKDLQQDFFTAYGLTHSEYHNHLQKADE